MFEKYFNKFKKNPELLSRMEMLESRNGSFIERIQKIEKENRIQNEHILSILKNLEPRESWLLQNKNKFIGQQCFLIGGGSSLNEINLNKLSGKYIMGVNGAFLLPDINCSFYCTVSYHWYKEYLNEIKNLNCERKFFPSYLSELNSQNDQISWLNVIEDIFLQRLQVESPLFFSKNANNLVVNGGSVLIVALQILYYLGFKVVVLLGVDHDFKLSETEKQERRGVAVDADQIPHFKNDYYKKETGIHLNIHAIERGFQLARDAFEADGRNIFNASPNTKLEIIEKKSYSEFC